MFCHKCGEEIEAESNFCPYCGTARDQEEQSAQPAAETVQMQPNGSQVNAHASSSFSRALRGSVGHATERLNEFVGEKGELKLDLSDVFSEVFTKHTQEEAEMLFAAGTCATTPKLSDIPTTWPKPWLFARVFLIFALTYVLLYICIDSFSNSNALPGLIVIGSFAGPFALLIFFWEMNAPQNISIYETAKMFFVGGAASLVAALVLYAVFPVQELDVTGAIMVGIIEEIGKLMIIGYFVRKLNPKYILNGLLIGAAIGAGFAAFESAGYAFRFMYEEGLESMLSIIFMRGWQSVGGHVVWSAIGGAAIVYAKRGQRLSIDHFTNKHFLKLFIVPVALHAIWDMIRYPVLVLILIVIAWVFIFTLINAGLKQIVRLNKEAAECQARGVPEIERY